MRECGLENLWNTAQTSCVLWQVWLQEVAWTEADKIIKLAARSAMIPHDVKMEKQPLFCYETMLNLLYWSCLVYDHDRVRDKGCV